MATNTQVRVHPFLKKKKITTSKITEESIRNKEELCYLYNELQKLNNNLTVLMHNQNDIRSQINHIKIWIADIEQRMGTQTESFRVKNEK